MQAEIFFGVNNFEHFFSICFNACLSLLITELFTDATVLKKVSLFLKC